MKIRILPLICLILLLLFSRYKEGDNTCVVAITGDLSELSHAYFLDIDYRNSNEGVKTRYQAKRIGRYFYCKDLPLDLTIPYMILIFKDGTDLSCSFNRRKGFTIFFVCKGTHFYRIGKDSKEECEL